MSNVRKQYSSDFKAKVALIAMSGEETIAQIASRFSVHPTMINSWKKLLEENVSSIFDQKKKIAREKATEDTIAELYRQIGQLKVEKDFLAKRPGV
jgi:transposase